GLAGGKVPGELATARPHLAAGDRSVADERTGRGVVFPWRDARDLLRSVPARPVWGNAPSEHRPDAAPRGPKVHLLLRPVPLDFRAGAVAIRVPSRCRQADPRRRGSGEPARAARPLLRPLQGGLGQGPRRRELSLARRPDERDRARRRGLSVLV